jgi:single-stranded DNA-binding protein
VVSKDKKGHEEWYNKMNSVILNGKIIDITTLEKVVYITILCNNGKSEGEFIPVTIFNTEFFNKYFYKGKWISILGHIHMNRHDKSTHKKAEVIADQIYFSGDAQEIDHFVNECLQSQTGHPE